MMMEGIFQEDKICQEARYIFTLMVTNYKDKKTPDYEKIANDAFLASHAFHSIAVIKGHLVVKSVK